MSGDGKKSSAPDYHPPVMALVAALSYNFFGVTGFTISLPTSKHYGDSLGGSLEAAGLIVGLYPLLSSISQVIFIPVLSPKSGITMKTVFIVCSCLQITGWLIYATAPATTGLSAVFLARGLCGIASGQLGPYYIARAYNHDPVQRKAKMMMFSRTVSFGYAAGPFFGLILESALKNSPFVWLNGDTSPGFLMMLLFSVEIVLQLAFFTEPPYVEPPSEVKPSQPTYAEVVVEGERKPLVTGDMSTKISPYSAGGFESETEESDPVWKNSFCCCSNWVARLVLCFVLLFLSTCNRSIWEVVTVYFGEEEWGWGVEYNAAYLGSMNLVAALISVWGVKDIFKTRKMAMEATFIMGFISAIFFLAHKSGFLGISAPVVYGVGSLIVQSSAIIGMGAILDEVASMGRINPKYSQVALSLNSVVYMLGRSYGSIVAPYLSIPYILNGELYATYTFITNTVGIVLVYLVLDMIPLE